MVDRIIRNSEWFRRLALGLQNYDSQGHIYKQFVSNTPGWISLNKGKWAYLKPIEGGTFIVETCDTCEDAEREALKYHWNGFFLMQVGQKPPPGYRNLFEP